MAFSLQDLTGEQYDEVELIVGQPIETPGTSMVKVMRAVGYVRAKATDPDLTFTDYNRRSVAEQIAASGMNEDDDAEGKDASS